MLIVTKSAVEVLKTVLDNLNTQPDQCVRLTAIPDGKVGLTLDVERQGDQVVRQGEERLLVVDSETAKELDGVRLKYRATEEHAGFTLLRKARQQS